MKDLFKEVYGVVENIKLTNEATLATLELDMVTTPYYILEKVDWGQISATHHSFKCDRHVIRNKRWRVYYRLGNCRYRESDDGA